MSIGRIVKKIVNFPAILAIRTYQKIISPLLPPSCRFYPSCSQYGLECFQKHHIFKAFWLTCWRILRCNPFNDGGHDPVPPNNRELKAVKEALPQSRDSQ